MQRSSQGQAAAPVSAIRTALVIVTVALLVRLVVVFFTYRLLPASDHFERFGAEMGWTARSLATGHGFSSPFFPQTGPTALVPPLFPLLLAGIFKVFGVYSQLSAFVALAFNSLLSSLTCAVLLFGLRDKLGFRTARLAAWIWALYPYAVYYSAAYLWDCPLTSLLFLSCFFIAWNRLPFAPPPLWGCWGVLAGLAALSNPSVLTSTPFLLGLAAWRVIKAGLPVRRHLLAATALLCATIAPWCVRNYRVLHQPILMRDGFWGEFYAGNCGDTSHSNPGWTHPASNPAEMRQYQQLGELGYMARKHDLSIRRIERYPASFVETSLRRVVRFWTGYWSFSRTYLQDESLDVPNVPLCTAITLLMAVGVGRLVRRSPALGAPFLAVLLVFPLPYYITHASMDYRQPIEPIAVAALAYGVQELLQRARQAAEERRLQRVAA